MCLNNSAEEMEEFVLQGPIQSLDSPPRLSARGTFRANSIDSYCDEKNIYWEINTSHQTHLRTATKLFHQLEMTCIIYIVQWMHGALQKV